MGDLPASVVDHYRLTLRLSLLARRRVRRAWRRVDPSMVVDSWDALVPGVVADLAGLQRAAAVAGGTYTALALAEQGAYEPPAGFTDPDAFTGWMVDDSDPLTQVPVASALRSPAFRSLDMIGLGIEAAPALDSAGVMAMTIAATAVSDAARQAASVDILARPRTGYVRMLNPPSCSRCVVLAGRFYAWNAGFRRHPHCDCVHVPTNAGSLAGAKREGLVTDPYDYFNSLSEREQARVFTAAGAQAIRDGADIYQVVNARRGMAGATRVRRTGGHRNLAPADPRRRWTSEGTTPRSNWVRTTGRSGLRLTPEGIYSRAATREEAVRLLTEYGYLLPAGQVPGGSILGPARTGFGQMGRGGARVRASTAVLDALSSGVRDTSEVATMTAAERRVHDARRDWTLAASGIDPASPGAVELRGGARIGGTLRPATPEMAARYERAYRDVLARRGEHYMN